MHDQDLAGNLLQSSPRFSSSRETRAAASALSSASRDGQAWLGPGHIRGAAAVLWRGQVREEKIRTSAANELGDGSAGNKYSSDGRNDRGA